ncbi:Serine/threonine protein kinase [Paraburkholderia ribeironis]|uniref:Serine/threonine protein kinase n=1 Tax=Paraburkholderia ribeironis TaxID=1247936 RepID=A0A1N7S8L9_9BURK|nr:serine/threonine-protein kinase [Paraburkholderia ribeironis]SIT43347.1 Serine/threonine protein kinase [Paraburkholderia ribeironis]
MSFRQGQRVGPYVIERKLGAGGMASVWLAYDEKRAQNVAIKIMADAIDAQSQLTARFLDEIRHHALLRHPGIVTVLDVFSVGGQPCLVMDLAPGGSLASLLDERDGRRLPVDEALPLIGEVLDALDYAHRQGMVHRDVKPSNVLLDASKRHALLSDFGIALAAGERRRTRAGQSVGTTAYMSPEQIRATGTIDFRSDVYSVGCVLYELLTGRPPFVADGADASKTDDATARAEVLGMHMTKKPVPPHRRVLTIPHHVSELIMRALEKDPAHRVPGCAEFKRLLNAPTNWRSRVPDWLRSPIGIAAAIAFAAAAVLGAMAVMSS